MCRSVKFLPPTLVVSFVFIEPDFVRVWLYFFSFSIPIRENDNMKKAEKEAIIDTAKKAGIRHLIFKKDKTIRAMSPYFYRGQGGTEESIKAKILTAFPNAEVIKTGDQFTSFVGGAPVHKQSHIYVIFKLA